MSHDASYIVRDGDQQHYFYSRWGGVQLASDLLRGPESFQSHIRGFQRLERPFLEKYINSLAVVDLDERRLRYWGANGFGFDPVSRRMYQALLQLQWPGWKLEWLYQPADTMDVAGPRVHTTHSTVAEVQAWQSELWHALQEKVADLIEKHGEVATRTDFETPFDQFNTWVSVRSEQGLRDELLCNHYGPSYGELFLLGPQLVAVLDARPQRSFDELHLSESQFEACCFIDLVEHCFYWWVLTPGWSPFFDMQKAWPGWEVKLLTEGPISQLEMSGRAPNSLLSPYCLTQLDEWFTQLLGPRPSPIDLLTKVADNIVKRSGGTVAITSPGVGSEGIPQTPSWANELRLHYEALLNTPAFQIPPHRQ